MEKSLRVQVLKRNICYWGKIAETMTILFVGIILFYLVIFCFTDALELKNGADTIAFLAENARNYLIGINIMIPLILPMSSGMQGLGVTVALGGRRSEAVWGMQFMTLLLQVQLGILFFAANHLAVHTIFDAWIGWVYVTAIGLLMALGNLFACMAVRFGTKGAVAAMLVFFIALIGGGFIFGFQIIGHGPLLLPEWVKAYSPYFAVPVSLILYGVSIWLLLLIVKNYEVAL